MPGLERGLLPLALLSLDLGKQFSTDVRIGRGLDESTDWGPYEPWARPLVLLSQYRRDEAAKALRQLPDPPRDLLLEAMWCLVGRAAIAVEDRELMEHAHAELASAAAELAGSGSGLLTLGPVARHLDELASALRRPR
jgi:hypothetical protein